MDTYKIIEVKESVFADNDREAARLRQELKQSGTFLLNLMSSPGSGKTTTLLRTIETLKDELRMGVMEADIDSDVDARKIAEAGVKSIQLHTGGMCHLDAGMTEQGLREIGTDGLDLVVLENVGNLVCPAEFDTGAVKNAMILSVPEGHDKPLKYPLIFTVCDALLINKTDVLPYFDFDMDKVVEYAHDHGVVVEAELGTLAGIEDEVKVAAHEASYTRPEEVEEFVAKTGCDSLAIAIGTSHGAYKFKPEQCTRNADGILVPPPLRFDVLKEVSKRLPGFPIVLHGSSSVPQEYVKMINEHGGKMPNAIGVPEEQLRQAARLSVCKINIDSDLRLAMTGTIRQFMDEHPDKFDPREYLKPARANIKELVRHKLVDVLGCAGKA